MIVAFFVSFLIFMICWTVWRRKFTIQNKGAKMATNSAGPLYDEPEDIKSHPQTQENVAYGHVQSRL